MTARGEIDAIIDIFRVEVHELVQGIGEAILGLERATDDEQRRQNAAKAFRNAHSIKGSAATLDLGRVEKIVHALEDLLASIRDGRTAVTPETVDVVFTALDVIDGHAAIALPGDRTLDENDQRLIAALRIAAGMQAAGPAPEVGPSPAGPAAEADVRTVEEQGISLVRVPQRRLDTLLARIGEIVEIKLGLEVLVRAGWSARHHGAGGDSDSRDDTVAVSGLEHQVGVLGKVLRDVQDELKAISMVPLSEIFPVLRRAVRDVCRKRGILVQLDCEGGEHAMDRAMVGELKAPLIHLLRNAAGHGIEAGAARAAAGKPEQGHIVLKASHQGNTIRVEVTDDGAGIDFENVLKSARKMGWQPSGGGEPSRDQIAACLFLPGLSTSREVDSVSGRGVGLDVVKKTIEGLRGSVTVESQQGKGTTFRMTLPLTLATDSGLFVRAGAAQFVIPRDVVERVVSFTPAEVMSVHDASSLWFAGRHVPMARLDEGLALSRVTAAESGPSRIAVIITAGGGSGAVVVDEVKGEGEIVMRGLGRFLGKVDLIAGITVTSTGEMCYVLDHADILDAVMGRKALAGAATATSALVTGDAAGRRIVTILVVDDSVTSRTLNQKLLSSSGFSVLTASGAVQALEALRTQACDVVITDVQMPEMDGYELTRRIKLNPKTGDIPVVLLTALDRSEDKERGLDVGADAYLIKGSITQAELVATINDLV